jgi:cytochrome d ubiquinol oxidase subunit I
LQILSGDLSARTVAKLQPAKLAAMEAHYHTSNGAPLIVGGLPDDETRTTRFGLEIPRGLSLLTAHDPNARVAGLEEFPREDWPNVRLVHWSFDLMVAVAALPRAHAHDRLALVEAAPAAGWKMVCAFVSRGRSARFIAIEAGWMVMELGRQPWIIYGVMRTSEAVTSMPGIAVPFYIFTEVYIFLALMVVYLLRAQFLKAPASVDEAAARSTHV